MLLKTKIKHNSSRLCSSSRRSVISVLVSPYTCAKSISGKQNVIFSFKNLTACWLWLYQIREISPLHGNLYGLHLIQYPERLS